MAFFKIPILVSLAIWNVSSLTLPRNACETPSLATVSLVGLVPDTPTLENLAVRQNGDVLVSSVASPKLHQVSSSNLYRPVTVAEFTFTRLLGITDMDKDIFYVISSNPTGQKPSNAVWRIDLRGFSISPSGLAIGAAQLSHITDIPDAVQLKGMTRLNGNDASHILLSDSGNGSILRLNFHTGYFEVVITDSTMTPLSSGIGVGVNGIHTFNGDLYFTSLDQKIFVMVPISSSGVATGPIDILATNITNQDDFTLSSSGTYAWIATNGPMELIEVDILKRSKEVRAFSQFLDSASSVALVSTNPSRSLYVTGALAIGDSTQGQLARVDLSL